MKDEFDEETGENPASEVFQDRGDEEEEGFSRSRPLVEVRVKSDPKPPKEYKYKKQRDEKNAAVVARRRAMGWSQRDDGTWVGRNGKPVGRPRRLTEMTSRERDLFSRRERGVYPTDPNEDKYDSTYLAPNTPVPMDEERLNQTILRLRELKTGKTSTDKALFAMERRTAVRVLLFQGYSNSEIADRLQVVRRTIWKDVQIIRKSEAEHVDLPVDPREKYRWLETSLGAFLELQFRTRERVSQDLIEREAESIHSEGSPAQGAGNVRPGGTKRTKVTKKSANWGALASMDRTILETYDRFARLYGLDKGVPSGEENPSPQKGGRPSPKTSSGSVDESIRAAVKDLNPGQVRTRLLDVAGKKDS